MPDTKTIDATAVSAIVSILLLLITIYYAWQTRQTVKEMEKDRKLSHVPIISFELEVDREKPKSPPGQYNKIFIQNIGNTPAQETVVTLKSMNPTSRVLINPQEWKLFLVGEDQQKVLKIEGTDDTDKVFSNLPIEPILEITSISQNSYGVVSKTIAEFKLQQSVWIKLKETATIAK